LPSRPEKSEILREIKIKAVMEGFDLSHKQLGNLYKSVLEIFNSLPKHRQTIANMNALINNAFTDMAKNAKKASDSTKSLADGFIKLNGAALHGVKNILALGFGFTTISSSLKGGVSAVENYNNSLVAVSGSFKKYGMGVIETEGRIKGLGKTLNMTQGDVLKFFSAYEKGFRSFSAGGFEKMMVNIQKAVGLSTDAQNEMLGSLSQLSAKIPELQGSIERLDASDKKRIGTMTKLMLLSGKMSLQEYKSSQTYLKSSLLISTADKKREAELKKNQEAFAKLKIASEKFMLAIGKALMPIMVKFADSIDKIAPEVEKFFNKMESFVTSAVQNWDQLKDIIVAIGVAAASIKLGAMAMKLGTGAVSLAGGLAAGMGMGGGGGGGIGAAGGGYASRVAGRGAYGANGLMAYGIGYGVTQASESMKSSARAKKDWGAERGAAGAGLGGSALKIGGLAATGFMFGGPAGAAIGAAIGGITEAGNIFNNAVTLFEDSATKIARAVKTGEKDEKDVKDFKKDSKAQYEKTQTSMIFAKAEEKKMAEEIEKARQYGKDSINDPVKRKELEKRGKESEEGLTLANQEFEKSQEFRVTTLNLSGDDKRNYSGSSEARMSAMEESKARLSMDLSNAQAGKGEDAKSDGFINALKNDIELLSKSIGDVGKEGEDASKSFVSGGKTLAEWNLELAKSRGALEEITTAEAEVVRKAQQQKAVTEAITGSLLEQSEVAAMTGRIVEEDLLEGFKKITAEMDTEMSLLNERLSILKKSAEATSAEDKKLEAYKVVQADIANTEKEISGIFTRKVNLASQLGDKYKYQLSLAEKQTSLFTQMVSLADNFAIGVGASADMRMMAVESMEKEIGLLEKEKNIRIAIVNTAEANGSSEEAIIPLRERVLETEGKILQKKIQQAEQTKVLRDGWISALGSMNTGAGRFTKILITQQQNLQSSLKLGGVVSSMSGALGGGYTKGAQFSAQGPGIINPEQGGVGGGTFAYNTTIPQNGASGIQDVMRNRTAADAAEYANNALDHANGANGANGNRRRYEGQAAIDQPNVLSSMQDGARQTGRNQQGQGQGQGQGQTNEGQRQPARVRGFVLPDRKSGADWRDGESFANGTRYINNKDGSRDDSRNADGSRNYESGVTGVGINVQTGNTRDGINVLPMPKGKSSWPTVGPSGYPTSPIADANTAIPTDTAIPNPIATPVSGISVQVPELGKDVILDAKNRITELDIKAKTGGYDKESQEKLAKEIAEEKEVRKGIAGSQAGDPFDIRIKNKEELLKQKQGSYNAPDEIGMSREDWQNKIKKVEGSSSKETEGWNKSTFKTAEEASGAADSTRNLLDNKKKELEKRLLLEEAAKNFEEKDSPRLKNLKDQRSANEGHGKNVDGTSLVSYTPPTIEQVLLSPLNPGGLLGAVLNPEGERKKGIGEREGDNIKLVKAIVGLQGYKKDIDERLASSASADSNIADISALEKLLKTQEQAKSSLLEQEKVAGEQKKEANKGLIDSLGYGADLVKDALEDGAASIAKEKKESAVPTAKEKEASVVLPTAKEKEASVVLPTAKEKEASAVPTTKEKEASAVVPTTKEKEASAVVPTAKEKDFQDVQDAKDDWHKSRDEVKFRITKNLKYKQQESDARKEAKDFQENGQKELTGLSAKRTNESRQLLSEKDPGARKDLESSITSMTGRIDELNKTKEKVTKNAARWDTGGDMKKDAEANKGKIPEAANADAEKWDAYNKKVGESSDKGLSTEEKGKKEELLGLKDITNDFSKSYKELESINNKIEEHKQQESDARRDVKYFQENDQKELTELSTKRTDASSQLNISRLSGEMGSGARDDLESSIASMTERIDHLNKTKGEVTKNAARWDTGGDMKKDAEANLGKLPEAEKVNLENSLALEKKSKEIGDKYGKDALGSDFDKYASRDDTKEWEKDQEEWNSRKGKSGTLQEALDAFQEQDAPKVRENAERGLDPNYKARYSTVQESDKAMKGTERSIEVQEHKMGRKSEADELLGINYADKGEDQKILDGLKELYKKQEVAEIGFLEEEKKANKEFKDTLKEGSSALKDGLDSASEKMTDFATDPVKTGEIKEKKTADEEKKAARDADMENLMKNVGKKKENTDPDFLKMMQNAGKTPTMDEEIDNSPFLRMKYDSGSHIASEGEKFSAIPKLDTGGTIEETGLAVVHKGETVVPAGSGGDKSGIQLSIGQIVVHLEAGELDMLPSMIASAINSKLSGNPAARSIYSGGRSEAGGMINGGGRSFINAP